MTKTQLVQLQKFALRMEGKFVNLSSDSYDLWKLIVDRRSKIPRNDKDRRKILSKMADIVNDANDKINKEIDRFEKYRLGLHE